MTAVNEPVHNCSSCMASRVFAEWLVARQPVPSVTGIVNCPAVMYTMVQHLGSHHLQHGRAGHIIQGIIGTGQSE